MSRSDRGDVLRQRVPFSKGVLSIIIIKLLYEYHGYGLPFLWNGEGAVPYIIT